MTGRIDMKDIAGILFLAGGAYAFAKTFFGHRLPLSLQENAGLKIMALMFASFILMWLDY